MESDDPDDAYLPDDLFAPIPEMRDIDLVEGDRKFGLNKVIQHIQNKNTFREDEIKHIYSNIDKLKFILEKYLLINA